MVLENLVATIGKTKLPDFISNPKGSRQFQQFIKLGDKELRNGAIEALCKQVPELAVRNIYALLTLEKIVTYGLKSDEAFTTDKILKPIMTDRKTVEQLLFHRLGCKFLNKLYMHPLIKPALKKQLCALVLVPRSVEIFGASKEKLRQYYLESCARIVDKELLGFEIVQRLMKQAVMDFPVSEDQSFNEEILNICADGLAHLLSSRDGVVVVVKLLGVASAKQKKNLIKELKGKFVEMARNSVTCVVILRLLQCVDDTVLLTKSVLGELNGTSEDLIKDASAKMVFLYILENLEMKTSRCYFQADRELMLASSVVSALKDGEAKSVELGAKFIPATLKAVMNTCEDLVKEEAGKDVLLALARRLEGENLSKLIAGAMRSLQAEEVSQTQVTCINAILKEFEQIAVVSCWSNLVARLGDPKNLLGFCGGLGSFIIMNLLRTTNVAVKESVQGALFEIKDTLSTLSGVKGTEIVKESLSSITGGTDWQQTLNWFKIQVEEPKKRQGQDSLSQAESKRTKVEVDGDKQALFDEDEWDEDEAEEDWCDEEDE